MMGIEVMEMNDNKKMTALVSLFALAYHRERYGVTVYDDPLSKRLLSEETYSAIAEEMTKGAPFFDSRLKDDPEPLRRVVDGFLSPAPLARAAFCAQSLETASRLGTTQYVLLGSGFDTFPYRQPDWAKRMTIFEVDRPEVIEEKQKRLSQSGI
ncbi:MAG: class I SAM-dependent methyltransferase, partial [Oscillospiraceae bacterium]|nr:class I SAM-dependent methyltransferase [Oscillospiraceae bacterium]